MARQGQGAAAAAADTDEIQRTSYSLFRRPDKYRIGDDFNLFVKKLILYFEAVELENVKKRRLALLFNLTDDAFRLAESVEFASENENPDGWKEWIDQLKVLFERNQTQTEKRYNFNKRIQEPGESVDSYAVSLREFGAKCGFKGEEYTSRLIDQFVLGLKDQSTQNKLLQEPPKTLDDAVSLARRFEAANATMQKLKAETYVNEQQQSSRVQIGAVSSLRTTQSFVIFKVSSIGCGYYKKASKILRRFFNLMPDAKKETLFESFQPCKPENIHIWLSVDINILGSKIKDKLLKSFIPSSLKSLEEYKTNGDARLLKLTLKAWENCLRADDSLGLVSPIHRTAVIDILMEAFNAFRTGECSDLDEDFFCLLFNSVGNVIQHIEEIQIQEVFQVVDSLLKNNTSELLQLSCCRFLSASKFIQFSTASQTQPGKLLSQLFSHLLTSKSFFIRRGALKSLKEFAEVTSHPEVVCDSLQDSMSDAFSMFLKQEFILDRLDDEQKEARLSGAFEGTGKANVQAHMLANDLQPKTPIMELREEVNEIGITQNEIENEMSSTKDKDLERAILEIREYLNNTNVLPEIATNLKLLARDINKAFEN